MMVATDKSTSAVEDVNRFDGSLNGRARVGAVDA